MACEYLGDVPNPVCRARRECGLVVPTIIEETRYCLTRRFRECVHWKRRSEGARGTAAAKRSGG
jgi:hypothetical protein